MISVLFSRRFRFLLIRSEKLGDWSAENKQLTTWVPDFDQSQSGTPSDVTAGRFRPLKGASRSRESKIVGAPRTGECLITLLTCYYLFITCLLPAC